MFKNRWFSVAAGSGLAALLLVGLLTAVPVFAQGGMMGHPQGFGGANQPGFGPGWMMGNFFNSNGGFAGMHGGMMINPNNAFYVAPPRLSIDEARTALNSYVTSLNDPNLKVVDIMIFDNHAYAQIVEKDSGIGVLEVLVDPVSKVVYPEMGPTMMWNQKFGMMSGYGPYGMMGGFFNGPQGNVNPGGTGTPPAPTITPEQAVSAAQSYIDANFATLTLSVDEHVTPFYGYYTLHVQQNGQTVGMLGVNGFSGAVWPHTWHGKFLEVSME